MIKFNCNNCRKAYSVKVELAGRKAKCKACGETIIVPARKQAVPKDKIAEWMEPPSKAPTKAARSKPATPRRSSSQQKQKAKPAAQPALQPITTKKKKLPVRLRRLSADAQLLAKVLHNFPLIRVRQVVGNPPESYQIQYNVRGLVRGPQGQPVYRDAHVAEIQLTSEYPRQSPKCRMLTPIFHPNIEPAMICVGDHWTAAERLVDLVIRIGELITFQAYNIKSPLDGEAAMWADQNSRHLPIDCRDLWPPGLE